MRTAASASAPASSSASSTRTGAGRSADAARRRGPCRRRRRSTRRRPAPSAGVDASRAAASAASAVGSAEAAASCSAAGFEDVGVPPPVPPPAPPLASRRRADAAGRVALLRAALRRGGLLGAGDDVAAVAVLVGVGRQLGERVAVLLLRVRLAHDLVLGAVVDDVLAGGVRGGRRTSSASSVRRAMASLGMWSP